MLKNLIIKSDLKILPTVGYLPAVRVAIGFKTMQNGNALTEHQFLNPGLLFPEARRKTQGICGVLIRTHPVPQLVSPSPPKRTYRMFFKISFSCFQAPRKICQNGVSDLRYSPYGKRVHLKCFVRITQLRVYALGRFTQQYHDRSPERCYLHPVLLPEQIELISAFPTYTYEMFQYCLLHAPPTGRFLHSFLHAVRDKAADSRLRGVRLRRFTKRYRKGPFQTILTFFKFPFFLSNTRKNPGEKEIVPL